MNRREFIGSLGAAAMMSFIMANKNTQGEEISEDAIAVWDRETELVAPEEYMAYLIDGNTRGLVSLEKLEAAFEKVMRDVKETVVTGDTPAVWSVYNMGYIVKTRESLFSIDLFHRRAVEFAPLLDFALITHSHSDHWRQDLYDAMDGAGKTVISNFLENSGAKESGLVHGVKTFKLRDVEIRTTLIDHNPRLIDFTTAFEIKIGDFILYHTGDSGRGTEPKLVTVWGRPDLWLFFPGCGIDTRKAVETVNPKRVVFGHLWELAHQRGHVSSRLDEPLIRPRLVWAREGGCQDVSLAFWGDKFL